MSGVSTDIVYGAFFLIWYTPIGHQLTKSQTFSSLFAWSLKNRNNTEEAKWEAKEFSHHLENMTTKYGPVPFWAISEYRFESWLEVSLCRSSVRVERSGMRGGGKRCNTLQILIPQRVWWKPRHLGKHFWHWTKWKQYFSVQDISSQSLCSAVMQWSLARDFCFLIVSTRIYRSGTLKTDPLDRYGLNRYCTITECQYESRSRKTNKKTWWYCTGFCSSDFIRDK